MVTQAPEGVEYRVKAVLPGETKETTKLFDGYDPSTGNLIDAKRWDDFPPEILIEQEIAKLQHDAEIADATKHMLELRISSSLNAARVEQELKRVNAGDVIVKIWPQQ